MADAVSRETSLKNIGKLAGTPQLWNADDFGAIQTALSGMNAETLVSTSRMLKWGEVQTTSIMKAKGFTADVIAQQLALNGAGKATVSAALDASEFTEKEIEAALASTQFTSAVNDTMNSTNKFGSSLKDAFKGLLTSPIGKIAIIGAAVVAAYKIADAAIINTEESLERLTNATTEHKANEDQITSLSDQLKTTQERMAEIQSMGTLTITEQDELANLQAESRELQSQISLLREKNKEIEDGIKKSSATIWDNFKDEGKYSLLDFWNSTFTGRGRQDISTGMKIFEAVTAGYYWCVESAGYMGSMILSFLFAYFSLFCKQ